MVDGVSAKWSHRAAAALNLYQCLMCECNGDPYFVGASKLRSLNIAGIDWNIFFLEIHRFFRSFLILKFYISPYIIWHIRRQTDFISILYSHFTPFFCSSVLPIVCYDNHEVNVLSSATAHCEMLQKSNKKNIMWNAKHSFGAHVAFSIGCPIHSGREA